jgi:hypothetical protein
VACRAPLLLAVLLAGCAAATPATVTAAREDLHAATGHDPNEGDCADRRDEVVELVVADDGFEPTCLIVTTESVLSVSNKAAVDHTFNVVDPPGPNPRHTLIEVNIPAGKTVEVGRVGDTLSVGSWPFYSVTGGKDRPQGTLTVRSPES